MCVWLTPQQRKFLVSVSITSSHGGSWKKKTHKPKTCPSKEAAVSPGMFTFRDGSLTVVPAAIDATFTRGGWTRAEGVTHSARGAQRFGWAHQDPGRETAGGLPALGWPSQEGPQALKIGRFLAPVWPGDTRLGAATTDPLALWGLPRQGRGWRLCAQLAVVQSGGVGWFIPKPLKNVLRGVGEGNREFFFDPHLFLHCSFDPGKREPSSCSGIWVRLYSEAAEAMSKKHA